MPRSCGLIRPSAVTADASVITSAAPPTARDPRCTRCQSEAKPSVLEYWHIGDTMMRWGSVRSRLENESNNEGICDWRFVIRDWAMGCGIYPVGTGSVPMAFAVGTDVAR